MLPPGRPPMLAMSAKLRASAVPGTPPTAAGARRGPTRRRPPRSSSSASSSSLANRPLATWPSAITQAPVSVAMSITACGLEALGIGQRVAQDQAAFGVGVEDLHRLARHAGDDVARAGGRPPGMFSHAGITPITLTGAFMPAERADGAEHLAGAAHVELHLVHFGRRLERDAAGVEGDAFADQHDGLCILARAVVAAARSASAARALPRATAAARPCRAFPCPCARALRRFSLNSRASFFASSAR